MNSTLLAALVGLVVALVMTPVIRTVATRLGVVAHPGGRRVHARVTPLLGGVAMYVGFMAAVAAVAYYDRSLLFDRQSIGILIGGTFMAIMGVVDDKFELPGWVQALTMVLGGVILVKAGVIVLWLTNPFKGGELLMLPYWVGVGLTIVWILMVTKAVDCMDGLDGLAAGIAAVASLTLMVMALTCDPSLNRFKVSAIMSGALLGSTLGFLRYNYPPAKLFMGTVGAQFLGFMLASVSIAGAFKIATLVALTAPVLLMGVPLFDTAFVVIRRILTGKKIHEADRSHLHHRLVNRGLSHRQVVWTIYALTAASCALAYVLFANAR